LGPSIRTLLSRSLEEDTGRKERVDDATSLEPHLEVALYRLAQEALTNVWKHAGASNVELTLSRRNGEVLLEQIMKGLNNRQIGDVLYISEDTVKTHVRACSASST
jgi:signal transduction histidine kinase